MNDLFETFWPQAIAFSEFVAGVEDKAELWRSYAKRAKLHDGERARLEALPSVRRVLVLVEDWCGDAVRSVPTIAAMDGMEHVEVRVLNTDLHPAALDANLTRGARAIPIALVFDGEGRQVGVWGPRPAPLQAMLRAKIAAEGGPTPETKGEFYAPIMAWYGQDRGRTVVQEMLMLLERGT